MVSELPEVDWSALAHAYGPAIDVPAWLAALRSPDDAERDQALNEFYGAVHHQGDVYTSTTASLPFLFDLAADPAAPGRAELVGLLVSIAEHAVDRQEVQYDRYDPAGSAAVMRSRAEAFAALAVDSDPRVRAASFPAPALVFEDPWRAFQLLRERLPAAGGVVERLAAVAAMGTLAVRRPECDPDVSALLGEVAADPAVDPATRLAAVVHRARCVSCGLTDDPAPRVIALLRLMAGTSAVDGSWVVSPRPETRPAEGVPPHVAAAFEELARANTVHAPTTELLHTLHELLGDRVAARTDLLAEQLRSPDRGSRLDAVRMSKDLVQRWRGDHAALVTQLARLLTVDHPEIGAEAAAVLGACTMVAEPAREALAGYVTARPPQGWAETDRDRRRGHQEAVLALARLGDTRSVTSLLFALDSGVDDWRAVPATGNLPAAAVDLGPRLCDLLAAADEDKRAGSILTALAGLRAPSSIPVVIDFLKIATRQQRWYAAREALRTLTAFGHDATGSLEVVRAVAAMPDPRPTASVDDVWPAAITALAAIGGDAREVLPAALALLGEGVGHRVAEAADMLGRLGPLAAVALPALRASLTGGGVWARVPVAAAIWDIAGANEAIPVLDALLAAWRENDATTGLVIACLDRMGTAAESALPQLRAWLARTRRGGGWNDNDEDLQHMARIIIGRF